MDGKWLCYALAIALAPCLLAYAASAEDEFSYCDGEGSYPVQVKSVGVDPNPVVRGRPATFSISGVTDDNIPGGKVKIEVFYYGIHVHTEIDDLCSKTTCPIKEGKFLLRNSESLPGFTPPQGVMHLNMAYLCKQLSFSTGSYKLRMNILDTDGNRLTCININFKIVGGSLVAENGIAAIS